MKVKLSMCLTNYAPHHEGVWRSGCIDPHFLDLGISWRWVDSSTARPLYPRGKSPWYPLDRWLGGSQSRFGRRGEEKILDSTEIRNLTHSVVQPVASRYADCAILPLQTRIASLLFLLFDPEDEDGTFPRNVGEQLPDYVASHSKR
jgi:hypothetical protein